jgi:hypothetical protein
MKNEFEIIENKEGLFKYNYDSDPLVGLPLLTTLT